jgi:hypothetical protein
MLIGGRDVEPETGRERLRVKPPADPHPRSQSQLLPRSRPPGVPPNGKSSMRPPQARRTPWSTRRACASRALLQSGPWSTSPTTMTTVDPWSPPDGRRRVIARSVGSQGAGAPLVASKWQRRSMHPPNTAMDLTRPGRSRVPARARSSRTFGSLSAQSHPRHNLPRHLPTRIPSQRLGIELDA